MNTNSGYFPFGFTYPKGFSYNEANPDPAIESIRQRMDYLNQAHSVSDLPGYIFAAALDDFQNHAGVAKDEFWKKIMCNLTPEQLSDIANALADTVIGAMPRLEFPNAIALFDCRFVTTKEWEHIRRYSIGGSEAAAVLGLSHFQSPRSVYFEKKAPVKEAPNICRQQILDYGHFVEDHIIESVATSLSVMHYPEHRMFAHKDYPFITCNPDGIFLLANGDLALFEAKTAFRMKRDEWKAGIPDYYAPQPRQYLEVLNDPRLKGGYIGVCLGGTPNDRITHSYLRDAEQGAAQIQKIVEFWENYIVPGVLPPLSGNAELDLRAIYQYCPNDKHDENKETVLSPNTKADFERYFELQNQRKAMSKQIKQLKEDETRLDLEIQALLPSEFTVCTSPQGVSYTLRLKAKNTTRLKSAAVRNLPPALYNSMQEMAERTKEPSLGFSIPKITRGLI